MGKNLIFYFTGTGNSLYAAKMIAKSLEGSPCELVHIPDYQGRELPVGYDRIGFSFPVYCGEPPQYVSNFIRDMDFSNCPNAYYFAIATYGGTQGNSFYLLDRLFREKGIRLNAAFPISMNGNYIVSYPPWNISKKKQAKIEDKLIEAGNIVRTQKDVSFSHSRNLLFAAAHKKMMPLFLQKDRDFCVSENCTSCGVCYKVCPVENIKMEHGHPVFLGQCEQCMACIHACPSKALNYKKITRNRLRYRNKNISLSELFHR